MSLLSDAILALMNKRLPLMGSHDRAYASVVSDFPELIQGAHMVQKARGPGHAALANQRIGLHSMQPHEVLDRVEKYMELHKCSYTVAFGKVELALANSLAPGEMEAGPPISGPNAALFGLYPGTDQKIFTAAWIANGRTMSPVNFGKVLEAVVGAIADAEGIQIEEAAKRVKEKFPNLWKMAAAAAK